MKSETMQAAGEVVGNKVAAGVASGTIAVSTASYLQLLTPWVSLLAVFAGLVLSCVLIRKHWIETEIMRKRANGGEQ